MISCLWLFNWLRSPDVNLTCHILTDSNYSRFLIVTDLGLLSQEEEEEDGKVEWMTDTSSAAAKARAAEQLSAAMAGMVTQGNIEAEQEAARKKEEKRRAEEEAARKVNLSLTYISAGPHCINNRILKLTVELIVYWIQVS